MEKTIEAIFDGNAFHPTEPVKLAPNTVVRITIETALPLADEHLSFLQVARSLKLEGPQDWSANIEQYLYGDKPSHAG